MADQKLRFIAEWVDKSLKRGAADAENAINKTQKASKSLGAEFLAVSAAAAGVGFALKQVYDFAKEGANLNLVASQFENVATNAGYAADVLLGKMRQATGGMVTDAKLMSSGLDIIRLGLADSEQGVVDLAKVVSVLGLDMQQVIMTFANNSELRLDALGLSVEGVKKRVAELNAEGFDGDAFDQAVLEGLNEQMEIMGDLAETDAGKIAKLETTLTNFWNNVKMAAADAVVPIIDRWNKVYELMEGGEISRARAMWLNLSTAFGLNRDKLEELYNAMLDAKDASIELKEGVYGIGDELLNGVNPQLSRNKDFVAATADEWEALGNATLRGVVLPALDDTSRSYENLTENALGLNKTLDSTIEGYLEQINLLKNGLLPVQQDVERAIQDYKDGVIGADALQRELNQSWLDTMRITGEFDGMSLRQIQNTIQEELGVPLELANIMAQEVLDALNEINGKNVEASIKLKWINGNKVPINTSTGLPTISSPSGITAGQAGMNYVIPPNFTGDSYPVRATAGERVQVSTASNTAQEERIKRLQSRQDMDYLAGRIVEGILLGIS